MWKERKKKERRRIMPTILPSHAKRAAHALCVRRVKKKVSGRKEKRKRENK